MGIVSYAAIRAAYIERIMRSQAKALLPCLLELERLDLPFEPARLSRCSGLPETEILPTVKYILELELERLRAARKSLRYKLLSRFKWWQRWQHWIKSRKFYRKLYYFMLLSDVF